MRKQVKGYFRRSLCGMLSAAMIAASLIVPDMTVYAAPQDEAGITTQNEEDKLVEGTTGEEKDADGENKKEDGNPGSPSEGDEGSGEDGDDKLDGEEEKDPDGDLKDDEGEEKDVIDEDLKSEDKEEEDDELLSIRPMAIEREANGKLLNGDFETPGENDEYSAASWTATGGNGDTDDQVMRNSNQNAADKDNHFFHFYNVNASTISLSQKIENVEPGDYSLSLQVAGEYPEDGTDPISVEVQGTSLAKKSLGAGPGWDKWKTIEAGEFNIPEGGSKVDIEVIISGTLAAGKYIDLDNVELKPADENSEGTEKTFYYYAGKTDDEVGLYHWGSANISSTADIASWTVWNPNDVYKMSPVTGYAGWYSIPITVTSDDDTAGFEIYTWSEDEQKATSTKDKCDAWNNKEVFTKLASGTEKAYAVKKYKDDWKCYEGEDEVAAILRYIKLYVYSTGDTPVIMVEKNNYDGGLSTINESGTITKLTADTYTDDYNNYYYSMPKDEEDNWYCLSFAVPGSIAFDNKKVIQLYSKKSDGTYEWAMNLNNGGSSDTWNISITPAFLGSIYYKNGVLSDNRSVSLGMLKELLKTAKEIKNEKGIYSGTSWNALQTAITGAETVVNNLSGKQDDYTDEESDTPNDKTVNNTYNALKNAIDGLAIEVTLYYYIGEAQGAGLTYWSNDADSPISTSAGTISSWHAWGNSSNTTYAMTAVTEYPGWYSIPIIFSHGGGEDAGFALHKYNGSNSELVVECSKKWASTDVYAQLISGEEKAYAVKKDRCYGGDELIQALMRNVKIYVYDNAGTPAIGTSGELSVVDESTGKKNTFNASAQENGINYYDMTADGNNTNWYYLSFSAPVADMTSKEICGLYSFRAAQDETDAAYTLIKTFVEGTTTDSEKVDFATPVFKEGNVYYKKGIFYKDRPSTIDGLKALVEEAEALIEEDGYEDGDTGRGKKYIYDDNWEVFIKKFDAAKDVIDKEENAAEPDPTDDELNTAYSELKSAKSALTPIPAEAESITVERVAVDDDFIMGVDVSSYVSVKESGVVFKDENGRALSDSGFFEMLRDGGTNWVRIRIWNDPYNSSNGGGYGGGNNDLDKAKIIGKLATDAGLKVLIDFHYSDFWADPAKQDAPKAWANYSVEQKETAVYNYTSNSLDELRAAGVNVCMVQVGNETNNGICGENTWPNMAKIFSAGSSAVRDFDPECLVAIHFAEPQASNFVDLAKNLRDNNVDYDVFASSYYPFWHGKTGDLKTKLTTIAQNYNKKVMVAETSWVTTWDDGDGHGNSAPKITQDRDYPVSLQGQADEIRDVVDKVQAVNVTVPGAAIGMFYWEPAWISPYYVYNSDGSVDQSLYSKNKELWEKYGSGWASSYSIEYDPNDAGLWYGGSAVDNQAWFDFDGKALETTKVYSYIRTAANAKDNGMAISTVMADMEKKVKVGDALDWTDDWANEVEITFNDGNTYTGVAPEKEEAAEGAGEDDSNENEDPNAKNPITALTIKWDEKQQELVNTDRAGVYTVAGVATCTYKIKEDGEATRTETFDVTLTIEVEPSGNILQNPGFENGNAAWTISDSVDAKVNGEDPRNGFKTVHFWDNAGDGLNFTVEQKLENVKAGAYTFGCYIQGGGVNETDAQYAYAKVYDGDNVLVGNYRTPCYLSGYLNWVQPEVTGIKVPEGGCLEVGMEVNSSKASAWGSIDDCYLYGAYGIEIDSSIGGKVTVSNLEASSKEVVRITATPDNGYYLSKLTVAGDGVTGEGIGIADDSSRATLDSSVTGEATLLYNNDEAKSCDTMIASFKMPDTSITISAEFTPVFGNTKISLDDENVTVTGFTEDAQGRYVYDTDQEYTGKNIQLPLNICYNGYQLTTADYTASYFRNKNVTTDTSMAEIRLRGKGKKFTGERALYFRIVDTKVDISKAKIEYEETYDDVQKNAYYYTGDEIEPTVKSFIGKNGVVLKDKDGNKLTPEEGTDYTITYLNNLKVGRATVIVIAKDDSANIKGSVTQTFTIAKRPITDKMITISLPSGGTYTGGKITPNVTVKYGSKILQKGKDYKLTYVNNVKVCKCEDVAESRKPYVKVTGIGSYTGTTDKTSKNGERLTFDISEKSIGDLSVTATVTDLICNNKDQAPKIIVKDDKKTLPLNRQYRIAKIVDSKNTVIYEYDKATGKATAQSQKKTAKVSDADTYKVTLEGLENYGGTRVVDLKVVGAEYMLSRATIAKIPNQIYTGNKIELSTEGDAPALVVTGKDGTRLECDTDYVVTYTNNIKAGTAKVTITAKRGSRYAGTKTATFRIVRRTIADGEVTDDLNKGRITYEFPESDAMYRNEDGVYCYPYTGYNWMPELKVYAQNGDIKKTLMKGVDYTITYKNNQKANDCLGAGKYASVTISGKGSYSGKVIIKDAFRVKDVSLDDYAVTVNPVTYSGKALRPAVTFVYKETGTTLNVKAGTAYTVKYVRNTNAASLDSVANPYVRIKEKGLRAFKQTGEKYVACPAVDKKTNDIAFTITTAQITAVNVTDIPLRAYNGKPSTPRVTVKVNGRLLKQDKDYLVTYQNNTTRNKEAVATIIGIGNYSGKVDKKFIIK